MIGQAKGPVLVTQQPAKARLGTAELRSMAPALARLDQEVDQAERIDRIRLLEELEAAVAAARAVETAAFVTEERAVHADAGVPGARVGQGVAAQVGLARRISPHRAAKYVGWAMILTAELPETFAALQAGRISEWRALLVAKETIWLSREHRAIVDSELAPRLDQLGDRKLEGEARRIGQRLDPVGYLARAGAAEAERHVSIRPAPDVMAKLSALLPAAQGIAAYTALGRDADRLRSEGDARGRGQLMADLLVQRLTGQATATGVPVEINLVMTDQSLLSTEDTEPALLDGYGPIPAPLARRMASPSGDVPAWIRRVFTNPKTGELAAMDSRRRHFTPTQRHFIRLRDAGTCRTPYCGAPVRHTDHIRAAEHGGPTTVTNGQGLCEACNYAKQAPGWTARTIASADGRHEVEIMTPTGHTYRSRAPDPPRRRTAA